MSPRSEDHESSFDIYPQMSFPVRCRMKDIEEKEAIPLLLRPWCSVYRSVPTLKLPFTNLDVGFTVFSCLALIGLNLSIILPTIEWMGMPAGVQETKEVAACLTSIVFSMNLVAALGVCLLSQPYSPSARMDGAPQWWQDCASALIQFCTGYMFYDSFVSYVVNRWVPGQGPVLTTSDWMFLGHHFATTFYMTSARLMGAGHMSAMILMFTGEFTNPAQNLWIACQTAIKLDCCNGWQFHVMLSYSEYLYALLYVPMRTVGGYGAGAHLTYDLLFTKQGRKNVHVWLTLLWMPMCWGVLIASIPWIEEAVEIVRGGLIVKYGQGDEL